MQRITFLSEGFQIAAHLYLPTNFDAAQSYSAIVAGGSMTSVKEQMAGTYAQAMANHGYVALAFDYRNYGESEGQPRQYENPAIKLEDLKAAVTYLLELPYVSTVGALGICTSAGNVAYLAAADPRVSAIGAVAGWFPSQAVLPLLYGSAERVTELRQTGQAAQRAYEATGSNPTVLAYSNTDQTASHVGPMEYYMDASRGGGVAEWANKFALMSWEPWLDFAPLAEAPNIQTPTAVVHSDGSALPDNARSFYDQVQGPKELFWLEGNHFDFYDQPRQVQEAGAKLAAFFQQYL